MDAIYFISILMEVLIFGMGLIMGFRKRVYGWCIAFTFGIYVIYDLAKTSFLNIPENILTLLFFGATVSMLWVVWGLYNEHYKQSS
ncbi:hypothetical protein HOC37_02115 [bacterium]|jgi:hypothetical protein|nr:hypothetical protein [bacterium]MBT3581650.1 hypothetical protein [bacterium]MBT4551763.1 hypothetical protein [bacterium]MBT5988163.1 hypothetical protein [bacterium]MBT7088166.1 hypothetical protein [bacterium]